MVDLPPVPEGMTRIFAKMDPRGEMRFSRILDGNQGVGPFFFTDCSFGFAFGEGGGDDTTVELYRAWGGGAYVVVAGERGSDGGMMQITNTSAEAMWGSYTNWSEGWVGLIVKSYKNKSFLGTEEGDLPEEAWIDGIVSTDGGTPDYSYPRDQYTFDGATVTETSAFPAPAPGVENRSAAWFRGVSGYWTGVTAIVSESYGAKPSQSFSIAVHYLPDEPPEGNPNGTRVRFTG